jgi:hypothetical protein
MEKIKSVLRTSFFAIVLLSFTAGEYACKPHKCVANGGEQPKKVNPYTKRKPQSGLFEKKMRRRH